MKDTTTSGADTQAAHRPESYWRAAVKGCLLGAIVAVAFSWAISSDLEVFFITALEGAFLPFVGLFTIALVTNEWLLRSGTRALTDDQLGGLAIWCGVLLLAAWLI